MFSTHVPQTFICNPSATGVQMFTLIRMLVLVVSHGPICMKAGGKEFTAHPSVLAVKEPIWCLNRCTPVANGLHMKV